MNTDSAIQEAGEELSTLLGLTLEAKMVVDRFHTRLETVSGSNSSWLLLNPASAITVPTVTTVAATILFCKLETKLDDVTSSFWDSTGKFVDSTGRFLNLLQNSLKLLILAFLLSIFGK